jgi:hypothetical protein
MGFTQVTPPLPRYQRIICYIAYQEKGGISIMSIRLLHRRATCPILSAVDVVRYGVPLRP